MQILLPYFLGFSSLGVLCLLLLEQSLFGAAGLAFAGKTRAQDLTGPQRLILVPMLNGAQSFFPTDPNGLSIVTEALAPLRDRVQFIQGLGIEGAENHQAVRAVFSGAAIRSYNAPDPTRPSVDQVIANHIASQTPTPVHSLHLGAAPADAAAFYQLYGRSTFFFDGQNAVPYEANPVWAYDALFGTPTAPAPAPEFDADDAMRRAALLQAQGRLDEWSRRTVASAVEQEKLARHRQALSQNIEPSLEPSPSPPTTCNGAALASVEALRPLMSNSIDAAYSHQNFSAVFDAQIDVLARAVVCGMTRVATLQAGSADGNITVPIEGGLPHHNTSHGNQAQFSRVQAWYASKLLRLAQALNVSDPLASDGSTVLDNSVIIWMAECMPTSHSSVEVPCLYIGGAGGKLRTGGATQVNGATNRQLLKTISSAFGIDNSQSEHFGDRTLNEVLR